MTITIKKIKLSTDSHYLVYKYSMPFLLRELSEGLTQFKGKHDTVILKIKNKSFKGSVPVKLTPREADLLGKKELVYVKKKY